MGGLLVSRIHCRDECDDGVIYAAVGGITGVGVAMAIDAFLLSYDTRPAPAQIVPAIAVTDGGASMHLRGVF
jgi:hypothetical protein